MKYVITENQLKLIRKYMKNFINEEMSDDDYERRQERGDMQTDPDEDEYGDKVKSLSIFYMSRQNMLNMKNNPKLEENDFSVRVDLNVLVDSEGNVLQIADFDGNILSNANNIINSLDINAPQTMEKEKQFIINRLREKVINKSFVNYIDGLETTDKFYTYDDNTSYQIFDSLR